MSYINQISVGSTTYDIKDSEAVKSVNAILPDNNGNVEITNVASANNLLSPDAQTDYSKFIYRTSGGSSSLTSGDAQLLYIDGNMIIPDRVAENLNTASSVNLNFTCNINTWKTQANNPNSGTYYFTYNRPSSSTATTSWTAEGTWDYYNGSSTISNVSLYNYGILISNMSYPSIYVTYSGEGITGAKIVPSTWFSQITANGSIAIQYNGVNWVLGDTTITLANYGITATTSDTFIVGDTITIDTTFGIVDQGKLYLQYTKEERGTIIIPTPTSFSATGFNQFNKNVTVISNAAIDSTSMKIISNSGTSVAYCHAVGGVTNGYVVYSASGAIVDVGWCSNIPAINVSVGATSSGTSTLASLEFANDGYFLATVTSVDDLCMHPKWSGVADTTFEAYVAPSTITIPTVDVDNNTLPTGLWGMPAVGAIADRLNLESKTYTQRIDRLAYSTANLEYVQSLDVAYEYDTNYIFYVLPTPITYILNISTTYTVNDWGTEEFLNTSVALGAMTLYEQNLRDKLRTDVLTISEQNLSSAQQTQVQTNLGLTSKFTTIDTNITNITELKFTSFSGMSWTGSNHHSSDTSSVYNNRYTIPCSGVTSSMRAEVSLGVASAISGIYSPICECYNGGVYIWAKSQTAPTILSILVHK